MRAIYCRLEFYIELVSLLKPEERFTYSQLAETGLLLKIPDPEGDKLVLFVPKETEDIPS